MIPLIFLAIVSGLYSIYKLIKSFIILKTNPPNFKGKTIWITGASSGIGEALAYKFSQLGANLILSSRRYAQLEEVKNKCDPKSEIEIVPFDLSDPPTACNNVEQFLSKRGSIISKIKQFIYKDKPINILIHNAGISQRSKFLDFPYKNHIHLVNLNVNGPFAITQPIVSHMIKNNKRNSRNDAQIVVISSMAAKLNPGLRSSYCSTKAALTSMFDSIRVELSEFGIKVTQIFPGYIRSYGSKNALTEGEGKALGGTDDDLKDSMDLVQYFFKQFYQDIFVRKAINAIYLEENEQMITASKSHYIAPIAKELLPELMTKITYNHYKHSQVWANKAKKTD